MIAPIFENRRVLVEKTLTEQQQIEMLGCKADFSNWVGADKARSDRLETLSMIIFALQGSYNESGIQRWFSRPRQQLNNRAPADILTGDWNPQADDVRLVRNLAQYLCGDREHANVCVRCNPNPQP